MPYTDEITNVDQVKDFLAHFFNNKDEPLITYNDNFEQAYSVLSDAADKGCIGNDEVGHKISHIAHIISELMFTNDILIDPEIPQYDPDLTLNQCLEGNLADIEHENFVDHMNTLCEWANIDNQSYRPSGGY